MFFSQAEVLKHHLAGKGEVGKHGHQVVWLEGKMGEVLDINWEGHWCWAVLHVFLSLFYLG
jgi:hypothetical protein